MRDEDAETRVRLQAGGNQLEGGGAEVEILS